MIPQRRIFRLNWVLLGVIAGLGLAACGRDGADGAADKPADAARADAWDARSDLQVDKRAAETNEDSSEAPGPDATDAGGAVDAADATGSRDAPADAADASGSGDAPADAADAVSHANDGGADGPAADAVSRANDGGAGAPADAGPDSEPIVVMGPVCLTNDDDGDAGLGGAADGGPSSSSTDASADGNEYDGAAESRPYGVPFRWPNTPPASNPFPPSTTIHEVKFTGRHRLYENGDVFIPTWGTDDNIYTPFTYGTVGGVYVGAEFGWAKLTGYHPLALQVVEAGVIDSNNLGPYSGAFPAASAIVGGVWYYGASAEDANNSSCGYWCTGGPFMGFWLSTDYGQTWVGPKDGQMASLFGESAKDGKKVKMGGPRFVDFGRELGASPDGKAYVIASGATDPTSLANWVTADQVYLARVTLTPTTANDVTAWEFYGGKDAGGKAIWSHQFADIKPLLEWQDQFGSVSMTYLPALKKYLMAVSRPSDGFNNYGAYDTFFLEADDVTGPFRMVQYLSDFGTSAYYVNIPSRFLGCDGKTMWIQYSTLDFTAENPPGGGYGISLQEIELDVP